MNDRGWRMRDAGCRIAIILICGILLHTAAVAETIVLKNGRRILCEILRETDEEVVVSKDGGVFVYSIEREKISEIRQSTPGELEELGRQKSEFSRTPAKDVSQGEAGEKPAPENHKKFLMERYEEQVEAAKKARGRIKIKFKDDRFGVVEATLNNRVKATLLVDTGASLVVITRRIANELEIEDLEEKGKIPVVLADGTIRTAIPITLKTVQVGHSSARDIEAAISDSPPAGGIDGLLGMSYLNKFHVKMDKNENCLVLEKY